VYSGGGVFFRSPFISSSADSVGREFPDARLPTLLRFFRGVGELEHVRVALMQRNASRRPWPLGFYDD
jgi:hypothetical protein